ncbi:hypothetical protein ACHAWT_008897 [Skeletonema menzelii]
MKRSRRFHHIFLVVIQAAAITSQTAVVASFFLRHPFTKERTESRVSDIKTSVLRLHSGSDPSTDRRSCVTTLILGTNVLLLPITSCADATDTSCTLPLEPASGGTFCVRCTVFGINANSFQVYRTIVDTGSPYLVLPFAGNDSGRKKRQRFTKVKEDNDDALLLSPSEYQSTSEIYGAVSGQIDWKLARYSFRDPRLQIRQYNSQEITSAGVLGVLDEALTNEATGGGTFQPYGLLGLIQNSNPNADRTRFPDPRPTFFEQECIAIEGSSSKEYHQIKSFCMNAPLRELTFSTESLIQDQSNAMQLFDLRKYGDFVDHYAVKVKSLSFDGLPLSKRGIKRPIVAVFDSGLTGCLLIRPFWNFVQEYYATDLMDNAKDARNFHSVSITMKGMGGTFCNITSNVKDDPRQFYVNPIDLDWFDEGGKAPYVIILGQTFLSQGTLTIDMDKMLSTFQ